MYLYQVLYIPFSLTLAKIINYTVVYFAVSLLSFRLQTQETLEREKNLSIIFLITYFLVRCCCSCNNNYKSM